MISNSFIFLERVSHQLEKKIWEQGILDWEQFHAAKKINKLSDKRKSFFDRKLNEAKIKLRENDAKYFSEIFPKSEMWRLYEYFSDECAYIDIETSGQYGDITVLGIYDGTDVMTLVKNRNLDKYNVEKILSRYKMIVTFNGQSFDVPVINRYFNKIIPNVPHLDLRFPLAKLGLSGGLKKIEKELNIRRSDNTTGMRGEEAIYLWHEYTTTGNMDALELLVEYNTEDIINLKPIAEFVYQTMKKNITDSHMRS